MAQGTYRGDANVVDYEAASAVDAGDVVVYGSLALVCQRGVTATDITDGKQATLYAEGLVDVVKKQEEITEGAPVYWDADGNPYGGDAGTGAATEDYTSNNLMGYAVATAASTDATVRIKIANTPVAEGS
jgi:predicted RecA/RadA family phage recombinase